MGNNPVDIKAKKIALVANVTWAIYNFRLNLIKALLNKGLDVVVIAPVDSYISYLHDYPQVKHIPLEHFSRSSINPFQNLQLFFELWRIYRREKPHLIIHYTIKANIFGSIAAAWRRIPSISVVTGLGYTFLDGVILKRLVKWMYALSLRFSQKVVFENPDDQGLFEKFGLVTLEQSRVVNGCGVNTDYFHPTFTATRPIKENNTIVFVFAGRLLLDKGIGEFIAAAKIIKIRFPLSRFWVAGDTDEQNPSSISKADLFDWINSGVIQYFGSTDDVRPFISQSDCVVLPSYREGLPKILLEAMAMAKPIITTDTPGCRQAVTDGENGFLVPVKSVDRLVKAMEEFCQLSEETKVTLGELGRKKAHTLFKDEVVTKQYLDIISEISGFDLGSYLEAAILTNSSSPELVNVSH